MFGLKLVGIGEHLQGVAFVRKDKQVFGIVKFAGLVKKVRFQIYPAIERKVFQL